MDFLKELESKNSELIHYFKEQLAGVRSNRPTTKLVENIMVDYMGQKLKVIQLGQISVAPPREIQISVWDRSIVQNISKAIESSLNLSAHTEDNLVKINLPPLSEERRQELMKVVKKEAEETRIKMRALRDDILKRAKHDEEDGKITEDEKFKLKNRVEDNVKRVNEEIERILENKMREINE